MKIHLDNVGNVHSRSGPHVFAQRLASAMFEMGHEVMFTANGADISLVFIEPSGQPLASKVVQRLDGVWTGPSEFHSKNVLIRDLYTRASAVVFQTEFDRRFITNQWGVAKKYVTIHNGIPIKPIKEFSSPELLELRGRYDIVFVCSSNWHRQKRLRENTDLYFHLRNQLAVSGKTCCLIVMGQSPDHIVADHHVFYTNSVPHDVYMQVYSMSDWMIHLAWRDHCPNVVVECLSQSTPVICSCDGGTAELIDGYGITLSEQEENRLELFEYDSPPFINVEQLCVLPDKSTLRQCPNVDIAGVAKKYIELFKSIG